MKKLLLSIALLALLPRADAFIFFGTATSASVDHANNIDNGSGTNTFLSGQVDVNTIDVAGSAGGNLDGRYYIGPGGVNATNNLSQIIRGSTVYYLGGYSGPETSLIFPWMGTALIYGYSPAHGIWAGATNAWFFTDAFGNLQGVDSTDTTFPLTNFQPFGSHTLGVGSTCSYAYPSFIQEGGHVHSLNKDDGRYLQHLQATNVDGGPQIIGSDAGVHSLTVPFVVSIPANLLTSDGDSIDFIFEVDGSNVNDNRGAGFNFNGFVWADRALNGNTFSQLGTLVRVDSTHAMLMAGVCPVPLAGVATLQDEAAMGTTGTDNFGVKFVIDWSATTNAFRFTDTVMDGATAITFTRLVYNHKP